MPRPTKKAKLAFSDDSDSDAGVKVSSADGFKINEEFAKRFEHNKKREEKQRLEEKYGQSNGNKRKRFDEVSSDESSDSDDESEDDAAELATEDVDKEISDVLKAIKEKDPRVRDPNAKFYKEFDPDAVQKQKGDKPMTLHDYQREKLLAGANGAEDNDDENETPIQTYQEEQDELKRQLVGSMHAVAKKEDSDADEDEFMVAKEKPKHEDLPAVKQRKVKRITDEDVKTAGQDPETYLSNFMQSRAWLPGDGARFQPLESDDSDDDKRAEEFEEAYNMRFEDPKMANEKLQSFARDVGKYGVRREEKSGRAKAREREREQKEAAKREREEEKARLRKLKVEEAEEKVKRIKEAAGLRGQELNLDEWRHIIDGDFDDEKWEQEMKRRFGEDYYNDDDQDVGSGDEKSGKKRKPQKPKFDDDIDIKDLIPDFDEGEKPNMSLSDEDDDDDDGGAPLPVLNDTDEGDELPVKKRSKKERLKEQSDVKRIARKERRRIEEMVDAALPLEHPTLTSASSSKAPVAGFRYRETSPTSFGLSARDILFADDAALNSYVGLKKMAAFRDPEKKQRDKKKYSKKQRVKQWRKENFGNPDEPTGGFEKVLGDAREYEAAIPKREKDSKGGEANVREGERKKRKRKNKKDIPAV